MERNDRIDKDFLGSAIREYRENFLSPIVRSSFPIDISTCRIVNKDSTFDESNESIESTKSDGGYATRLTWNIYKSR